MAKTDAQVEKVLNALPIKGHTRFDRLSYEDGIRAVLLWLLGQEDTIPFYTKAAGLDKK